LARMSEMRGEFVRALMCVVVKESSPVRAVLSGRPFLEKHNYARGAATEDRPYRFVFRAARV
jgi:hypothetical protein